MPRARLRVLAPLLLLSALSPARPAEARAGSSVGAPAAPGAVGPGDGGPSAPVGTVTLRYVRRGRAHPSVVAGVLSAPRAGTPDAVARAYLASASELGRALDPKTLELVRARALGGGGALVKYRQRHAGLEVVGGQVTVRLDEAGRVRWVGSDVATIPSEFSVEPKLTAAQALERLVAGPLSHYAGRAIDLGRAAQLVVWAPAGVPPRLAWRILFPRDVERRETLLAFVDAQNGRALTIRNLVMNDRRAKVYRFNPVSTPSLEEVTFDTLALGATRLESADVRTRNCVDKGECYLFDSPLGSVNIRWCDRSESTAVADASGDFLYDPPPPVAAEENEDEFSEVQMFYHVTRAFSFFRGLGLMDLKAKPLTAVVNLRVPPFDASAICSGGTPPNVELQRFDNAAFMPAGSLGGFPPEDWIVFGQGTMADFAYDGDVVYHEFGHAVMGTITPDLPFFALDERGLDPTPGGMHEGFPDYFSSAITGDGEVGEYAGRGLALEPLPSGAIRSLDNTKRCPEDIWAETHADSEFFSAALWQARKGVSNAARFDRAVYTVLDSLGASDDMETTSAKLVAEVSASMGAADAAILQGKLTEKGVDGCHERVVEADVGGVAHRILFVPGTDQMQLDQVPGAVQWRIALPWDATEIRVDIGGSAPGGGGGLFGGGGEPNLVVWVKAGEEPITWDLGGASPTPDTSMSTPLTCQSAGARACTAVMKGSFPAGVYHLQIANAGPTWQLGNVVIGATQGSLVDAGPGGGVGGAEEGGCGCRVGGAQGARGGAGVGVLVAMAVLAFVAAEGRRRRAGGARGGGRLAGGRQSSPESLANPRERPLR